MEFFKSIDTNIFNFNSFIESKKEEYAQYIVVSSESIISVDDAVEFANILVLYSNSKSSKNNVFKEFDFFTNYIACKHGRALSTYIIPFFINELNKNGIISDSESNVMNKNFIESITVFSKR